VTKVVAARRFDPRIRRGLVAFVAVVAVSGILLGLATGAIQAVGRAGLYATGIYVDGGGSTIDPSFFDHPATSTPSVSPQGTLRPVLADLPPGTAPVGAQIKKQIAALPTDGIGTPSWVVDLPSGKQIVSAGGTTSVLPASTLKLLTAAAALTMLGPDHRFTTDVVAGAASAHPSIVLVGGGDPYLVTKKPGPAAYAARASLADLADETAAVLKKAKHTKVALGWDESLFTGPAWNPTWPATYSDQTTATSALWVSEGRLGGSPGRRTKNPAKDAAAAFANELRLRGIDTTVTPSVTAPAGAQQLGSVSSIPLASIVEQLLLHSDNDAAEVVFRQLAVAANMSGSIENARTAARAALTRLGLWGAGQVMRDGSGLSRQDRVTPAVLVKVLELAMSSSHPTLRSMLSGLPVAGVDGSLTYRYFAPGTSPARGDVRAKTGTLTGVHALSGYAVTRSGELVVFAFVVNDADNDYNARNWLDRATATIAGCGCGP